MSIPEKGDLAYVDFDPQAGREQSGRRPALIISPKEFNRLTGFAVVCPVTNQKKGYPFEVEIPEGLKVQGVILTDQVKSLDLRERNFDKKDEIPESVLNTCIRRIHKFIFIDTSR
jgi:mRNA interferase MazF